MPDRAPKERYSRGDVRRLLGLTQRQLRGWERKGLIPAAESFTFSDLIALKTLQALRQKRIRPHRISLALESLKRKLAGVEKPLSELKIASDGRTITVHVAGQKMEAISGQILFDFDAAELGRMASLPEPPAPPKPASGRESETWFQRGLALEEAGAPVEQAVAAYQKSVELNPGAAGAWVNLGTIYYRLGQFPEAERSYLRAIDADPKYPLAHFNLGNLYDEHGDVEQARVCYEKSLHLNRDYADAHFNLALICERIGEPMKAVLHWKAYLKLDASSSWAEIARRQLERLRRNAVIPGARG